MVKNNGQIGLNRNCSIVIANDGEKTKFLTALHCFGECNSDGDWIFNKNIEHAFIVKHNDRLETVELDIEKIKYKNFPKCEDFFGNWKIPAGYDISEMEPVETDLTLIETNGIHLSDKETINSMLNNTKTHLLSYGYPSFRDVSISIKSNIQFYLELYVSSFLSKLPMIFKSAKNTPYDIFMTHHLPVMHGESGGALLGLDWHAQKDDENLNFELLGIISESSGSGGGSSMSTHTKVYKNIEFESEYQFPGLAKYNKNSFKPRTDNMTIHII